MKIKSRGEEGGREGGGRGDVYPVIPQLLSTLISQLL